MKINDKNYFVRNAVIESASLSFSERGILDMWLMLDYGGSGQGFGGFALYLPPSFKHHAVQSPAGHHIFRCLQVAGVEDFKDLKGKTIRVATDKEGGFIEGIGHIIDDKLWYFPEAEMKAGL